jgi:hypothetical protein
MYRRQVRIQNPVSRADVDEATKAEHELDNGGVGEVCREGTHGQWESRIAED